MRVLAGIVLYNPDLIRLKENIDAIKDQVDEIILIDNASENDDEISTLLSEYQFCHLIKNNKNEGIAKALNQILQYAVSLKYDWFLTLDQDSVCYPGLIDSYLKFTDIPSIGIITSYAIDRNTDADIDLDENDDCSYVTYCITSGAFMNTKACQAVGGWDEKLFIDNVDGDICIHMKMLGYKVICVKRKGILHEVGHGQTVHFLWKSETVSNHPPFRQYYMARNRIYVARKYPQYFCIWKELNKEFHNYRMIIMYEKNKARKIWARIRGVYDGFKIRCDTME